jgi:hypothetical protein
MRLITKSVLTLVFAVSCAGCVLAQGKLQVPDSEVVKKSIKAVALKVSAATEAASIRSSSIARGRQWRK